MSVSLIEPYRASDHVQPDPHQVCGESGLIEAEEYAMEKIFDLTLVGEGVEYLVQWEGWPKQKNWTWEPFEYFENDGARALLAAFNRRHPEKPFGSQINSVSSQCETTAPL